VCLVDASNEAVEETRIATTPAAFARYFEARPATRVALETGTHSPWISRLLRKCGHEVVVANARKVRLISESNSKNDRADAVTVTFPGSHSRRLRGSHPSPSTVSVGRGRGSHPREVIPSLPSVSFEHRS
jgi:hypothetical protein